ncbi:unnamed protein product, partial [Rotaria sordida]
INRSSNLLDNDDARVLLKQIDEWHVRTIDACCETADETRRIIVRLFNLSKFDLPENINVFDMENSAYASDEQLKMCSRIEDDFLTSMQTIERIINKILDGSS